VFTEFYLNKAEKSNISSSLPLFYLVSKLSFQQNVPLFLGAFLAEQLLPLTCPSPHERAAAFPELQPLAGLKDGQSRHAGLPLQLISSARALPLTGAGRQPVLRRSSQTGGTATYVNRVSLSPQRMIAVQPGTGLCLLRTAAGRMTNHRGTGC